MKWLEESQQLSRRQQQPRPRRHCWVHHFCLLFLLSSDFWLGSSTSISTSSTTTMTTTILFASAFSTIPTTQRRYSIVPNSMYQHHYHDRLPSATRLSYMSQEGTTIDARRHRRCRHEPHGSSSSSSSSSSSTSIHMVLPLVGGDISVPFVVPYTSAATTITTQYSYYLTRIIFLRALAFVYGIAFWIAKQQNKALIGDHGITPVKQILDIAQQRGTQKTKQRQEWLNSTLGTTTPVNKRILFNTILLPSWLSRRIHSLGMKINRNSKYQYWRERLWDRSDQNGRPITTLLWLASDRNTLNPWLDGIATIGISLSLFIFLVGSANVPILLLLWICQRSLMTPVGGPWYGFGWESQLAELGFHALFLVPLWNLHPIPLATTASPSPIVLYALRWYLFRIMIGAGLIKLRSGDIKWKLSNLSTMNYFYETQPIPNPFTKYFHWMPTWWHKGEVVMNHFVELIAPWFLLVISSFSFGGRGRGSGRPPILRSIRIVGGWIQIIFQGVLISSGNLSFLNWLTAVPAITCLDDAVVGGLFREPWRQRAAAAAYLARSNNKSVGGSLRQFVSISFALLIVKLSIPVVKNLLSKHQVMNTSFDKLRLVNSYGAFGTVTEQRDEFIISASTSLDGPWKEYEFKVKPGNIYRRPRFISPYHYRLDWLMWIAATIGNFDRSSSWLYPFLFKLLEQDSDVVSLLDKDPFQGDAEKPKYIRIDKYRYTFHKPAGKKKQQKQEEKGDGTTGTMTKKQKNNKGGDDDHDDSSEPYWDRELIGRVFPRQGVATKETIGEFL